jgi:plastocyanin
MPPAASASEAGAERVSRTALRVAPIVAIILALGAGSASAQPRAGILRGHVAFSGRPPGNPIIRMGMDPKCADLNAGRRVIQESALVTRNGSVENVFVRLDGTFPAVPVPTTPVVIDQRACVYTPRVVGVRVGQRLQIRNDDDLLHNVHSSSSTSNSFNVGQPKPGAVFEFTPKMPEVMVKIACDVHRWMTAYVGVMAHPYFSVTDAAGTFAIASVPPGTYTVKAWHEQFGELSRTVTVRAGATTTIDFSYSESGR